METKLSVLITCYNGEKTIRSAIESVLNQVVDFKYQFIIVDDGSTDNSPNIIKEYSERADVIISDKNNGLMKTFEIGFNRCIGKYITTLDCDDVNIDNSKFQTQVNFLDTNKDYAGCFTDVQQETDGTIITPKPYTKKISYDNMLRGGFICASSLMFRRDLFEKYANHTTSMKRGFYAQDYCLHVGLLYNSKFARIPEVMTRYLVHEKSVSHTHSRIGRLKVILPAFKIKLWYIFHHGCKLSTFMYVMYRFTRDIYSVIFKRWYK